MTGPRRAPMTPKGHAILTSSLKHIKEVERPANVRAIEEAIAHGDLSENAEYHSAKEKQGLIQANMLNLEDQLSRAEVIDPASLDLERVAFGATVTLQELDSDREVCYQIVGSIEADASNGLISYDSPLARALLGKEEGDEFKFKAPGGERAYEVLEVEYK